MRNLFVWPEWTLGLDVDVITSAWRPFVLLSHLATEFRKPSIRFCGCNISIFSSHLISTWLEKLTTLRYAFSGASLSIKVDQLSVEIITQTADSLRCFCCIFIIPQKCYFTQIIYNGLSTVSVILNVYLMSVP